MIIDTDKETLLAALAESLFYAVKQKYGYPHLETCGALEVVGHETMVNLVQQYLKNPTGVHNFMKRFTFIYDHKMLHLKRAERKQLTNSQKVAAGSLLRRK